MALLKRSKEFNKVEYVEYFSPDGKVYNLSIGDTVILSEDGFGMPGIDYIQQKGPFQHGTTIYDYRLQSRVLQFVFRKAGCTRNEYWENRSEILDIMRPNRQLLNSFEMGTLVKTLSNGEKRAIDVMVEQGPTFQYPENWDHFGFTETIRFIAPDPTFYDPTMMIVDWQLDQPDHLILPFEFDGVDMFFGQAGVLSVGLSVQYSGTWISYPVIVLYGPFDAPVIRNLTTDEKLDISGINIAIGEKVVFDMRPGIKTVTSSISGNIIGHLTVDSDLATFHIACEPEANAGHNDILLETDINSVIPKESNISIEYYERYIAI